MKSKTNLFWASKTGIILTAVIIFIVTFGGSLILGGCSNEIESVPYAISRPEYKSGENRNICKMGGIYFDFLNKKSVQVERIKVCFTAISETSNTFTSKNTIEHEIEVKIGSGKMKHLCIPLDDYIFASPPDDLVVAPFYVSEIYFSDGSVWQDRFGTYIQ